MVSPLKLLKRSYSILKNYGWACCCIDFTEILRERFFNSRKYILMSLKPDDFIAASVSFETILFSFNQPKDLIPYLGEESELSQDFLTDASNSRVVIARDDVSGDLLAYGFFSPLPTRIDEEVFFHPPEKSLYLFKFFVMPEARGERIVRGMLAHVLRFAESQEFKTIIAIILANNFLSQKVFCSMGFYKIKNFILHKGVADQWKI